MNFMLDNFVDFLKACEDDLQEITMSSGRVLGVALFSISINLAQAACLYTMLGRIVFV